MRILFTCGGTAGHVNPAIALARLFQERHAGCEILFVGAVGGMETRLVSHENFPIRTVNITNFQRSMSPNAICHNAKTLFNMVRSKGQAKAILKEFQPDLVVGMGGYASYPVVNEAAKRGIPTAVHESNAVPGLTTKMLSKVVTQVMVGLPESKAHYDCPEKVVVMGTPVRGDFFQYTRAEARAKLGITDDRPLLLSYWGSLGASRMNQKMIDFIAQSVAEGSPFHHIHGAGGDYAEMCDALTARGISLDGTSTQLREYIYDMPLVMAACDLVLCRAGASTISELTAIAKPAILVPSPNVTANHQEKNARVLESQGGAVVLLERDLEQGTMYQQASALLADVEGRHQMASALCTIGVPDAGERIYQNLLSLMQSETK